MSPMKKCVSCPVEFEAKEVPAGVSKAGRAYKAFTPDQCPTCYTNKVPRPPKSAPTNPVAGASNGTIFQQSSAEFVKLYELLKIELAEVIASMKRIEKRMDEQMTARSPLAGPDAAGGSP